MHPNPLFRHEDRALLETLLDEIGFGMVFLTTPDGPRVAHTPLLSTGDGAVQFHLARGNALSKWLDGATALVTINGPDAYVSPRWYAERGTVPTWDYVALEMEGRVSRMSDEAREDLLHTIITKFESRLGGEQWLASESSEAVWSGLFKAIVGFELAIAEWRPTLKLSQKRSPSERERIAEGLVESGNPALAAQMREMVG